MRGKHIKVIVSGLTGSGKTTVAAAIAKSLEDLGFDIYLTEHPGKVWSAEETRLCMERKDQPEIIREIAKDVEVEIETIALRRMPL